MGSIVDNKLIFSNERKYRIRRHLLYWVVWYLHLSLPHAVNSFGLDKVAYFQNPVFTFTESFFVLVAQMPIVYTMLYFVLPRFILKHKYVLAFLFIILLWFLGGLLNVYL